jgi:hypothetical protein
MKQLIRKILNEEVNKKYPKPTEKVERLIYNWLNNFTSGAQMYQLKSYEFSYTFEWCNNGKEIMKVILDFDNDYNAWEDKRKTSERDFENGILWIPKDVVSELASDIPVRRTYLRYIIEEWFEDTFLQEIQKKMKRNDISIDEFKEYPEKSEVCVPPMEKNENVTEDEMIDFIVKNTLWNRKDLEKRILEDPEFIEKVYLEKLRDNEMKKLRGN